MDAFWLGPVNLVALPPWTAMLCLEDLSRHCWLLNHMFIRDAD
jgi:hypothetical protein